MKHRHSFVGQGYMLPFVLITFFFFLWGFARAILDVLNPFFQETFQINKTQASLIQFVADNIRGSGAIVIFIKVSSMSHQSSL